MESGTESQQTNPGALGEHACEHSGDMLVKCTIQGGRDEPETGVETTFEVPYNGYGFTLGKLKELFPYYGVYHFRLRVPDTTAASAHVWLDLTRDTEDVRELADNLGAVHTNGDASLHLKALPLSFDGPGASDADTDGPEYAWTQADLADAVTAAAAADAGDQSEVPSGGTAPPGRAPSRGGEEDGGGDFFEDGQGTWKDTVGSTLNQAQQGFKAAIGSRTAQNLQRTSMQAAKQLGLGAKLLWKNAVESTKSTRANLPSPDALDNLHTISALVNTPFDIGKPEHVALLGRLWNNVFPGTPYEPLSQRWREIGFQKPEVAFDFRGTGILSLRAMVYLCEKYEHKVHSMLLQQAGKSNRTYPFAVVGNNIALMLVDVLDLREHQFASTRAAFWGVFDEEQSFYELYCLAFRLLDHIWTEQGATREQFGKIIVQTKACIETLLQSGPVSQANMMDKAMSLGLLH